MADLRDERGNPIQLTDEFGKPVQLTDEFGNPMHIKGVATTHTNTLGQMLHPQQQQLHRSSSSEEDDGRKTKETLGEDKDEAAAHSAPGTATEQSKTSSTLPGHEKKGVFEKIKEKLPGHHHHHTPH